MDEFTNTSNPLLAVRAESETSFSPSQTARRARRRPVQLIGRRLQAWREDIPWQATAPLARALCTGRFVWEARTEEEECDESLSVAELLVSRAQQEQGQALQQVQLSQPQPVLSQAGAVSR